MKNNHYYFLTAHVKYFLLAVALFFFAYSEARAQAQYCTTNFYTGGCSAGERIDRVRFASSNNANITPPIDNANNTCGTNGYSDYTSMSVTVMRNTTHSLSVDVPAGSLQSTAAWADWNQDQDFDDPGEFLFSSPTTNFSSTGTHVNIPSYALLGPTRLRVRSVKNALLVANSSCTQFAFGETEDYTINVVANPVYCTAINFQCMYSSYISSVKFNTINNTSGCNNGYANYANISTTVQMGMTYLLEVGLFNGGSTSREIGVWIDYNNDNDFEDIGEFVPILAQGGGPLTRRITIPQNFAPGNKRMRVRYNSDHVPFGALDACTYIGGGETEDYTLNVVGQMGYCTIGIYEVGCISTQANANIASVTFAGITNPSACSFNGFGDFTHLVATVQPGMKYPITVHTGSPNKAIGIWIDFNRDFNFNDTDEFVYQSAVQTGQIFSDSILIPVNAPIGSTRMRIRTFSNSNNLVPQANQACYMVYSGETEDYTVRIMPPPGPVDVGVSEITGPKSSCGLGAAETVAVVVKNYGTSTQSNFPVSYSVAGGTSVSQVVSRTVAPGDTVHVNFATKANLSAATDYLLKSWTGLSADAQPLNDSAMVTITNFGNGIATYPYTENFDSFVSSSPNGIILPGTFQNGWSNATNDDIDWKVSSSTTRQINPLLGPVGDHTTGSANFVNVFFAPGYTANLESPCFDFTSLINPTLEFWYHMYDTSPGTLAVDVNVGGNWDLNVHQVTMPTQSARTDPWEKVTVSLLPYAGKVVRLRFRAVSGSGGLIALDDVKILNPPIPVHDISVSLLSSPQTGCRLKTNESVCFQITNHGNQTESNFPIYYQLNNQVPMSQLYGGAPLAPGTSVSYCFLSKVNLSAAGTYQLKVYAAMPNDSDKTNDTLQASVTNNLPDLNFTFTQTAPQTYQFTAQNAGTGNLTWDFGDGNTSTAANPVHQYTTSGNFTVKLTGASTNGCAGEVQQTVAVVVNGMKEEARKAFQIYPNPANATVTVSLADNISGKQVLLISALGVTLREYKVPAGILKTQLAVSELPAGAYFIKIFSEKQSYLQPLIITR